MTTIARFLLLACVWSASCYSSSGGGPQSSGNTNWLMLCKSDASCDAEASCVCGICTRACDVSQECDAPGLAAHCTDPGAGEIDNGCAAKRMDGHAGICLRVCASAADCSDGQTCEEGSCVASAQAAAAGSFPQEPVPSEMCDATLASCDDSSTLSAVIEHSRKATAPADPNARVWSCEGGALRVDPAGYDEPFSIGVTNGALLIAGVATAGSDGEWRVERRAIADLAPALEFGLNGAVSSGTTDGWDAAGSLAADSSFLYVAGVDGYADASGGTVRVEKRELASGALATDFGAGGTIELSFGATGVHSPSTTEHAMGHGLAIDADHLYLGGTGFGVEKRRLRDGAPVAAFGTAGIARSTAAHDSVATGVVLRDGVLYVAGPESAEDMRLEARAADSGELLYETTEDFADAGCQPQCVVIAAGADDALYLATTTAAGRWRIERRKRSLGTLVYAKELTPSGSCDGATALAIDDAAMYIAGAFDQRWRIEKRSLADGELIESFGRGGVIDPGIRGAAGSMALHDGVLYVAGLEGQRNGVQSSVWRVERRSTADGALIECPPGAPAVPRAPECASKPNVAEAPPAEGADCVMRSASANACAAASVRVSTLASEVEDWVLPEGAALADASLASVELASEPSSMLLLRGFGFSLPEDARVLGVTVDVTRLSAGVGSVADHAVRLVKRAQILDADRSLPDLWSSDMTTVVYGGENDVWGTTWSAADLNDPSFGVALRVRALPQTPNANAQLGAVRVRAHYCE